jgi:hypothetical protein
MPYERKYGLGNRMDYIHKEKTKNGRRNRLVEEAQIVGWT